MLHGHGVVGVVGCPDEIVQNEWRCGGASTCRAGGDGFAKTKELSLFSGDSVLIVVLIPMSWNLTPYSCSLDLTLANDIVVRQCITRLIK